MKKQEYVHTHALLLEIAAKLQEQGMPEDALDGYADLGVRPTSLHRGKTTHKQAVLELASATSDWIQTTQTDVVADESEASDDISARTGEWLEAGASSSD